MDGDAAYGLYCAFIGGVILTWGYFAGSLPFPFFRLSASHERVWYWSNMSGAGLAILIGIWFMFK